MSGCTLIVDLRSYWHAGAGRGGGAVLDAVVHRDGNGLPVLPGRHLKGLLRDALERAEAYQWPGYTNLATRVFGARAGADRSPDSVATVRVGDAALPDELTAWLAGTSEGRALIPNLYRGIYATAVDHDTGTARDMSLRGIEVTVPLELRARIEPVSADGPPPEGWADHLRDVLPLIDAVGAHRTRGLGRAVLSLEETA